MFRGFATDEGFVDLDFTVRIAAELAT